MKVDSRQRKEGICVVDQVEGLSSILKTGSSRVRGWVSSAELAVKEAKRCLQCDLELCLAWGKNEAGDGDLERPGR